MKIKRYVYLYLIVGRHCYLIDSGVAGAEKEVEKYLRKAGRSLSDIKAIFLTHAHPDHIGGAAKIKEKRCIFVGDTIPVKGDIPIWINEKEQIADKIQEALELIDNIREHVNKSKMQTADLEEITKLVCRQMGTPQFLKNPLFHRTIESVLS